MQVSWHNTLRIFAPLEQASGCLDVWLKEERRMLSDRQKRRAAALIARYFEREEDADDDLILSFLRHYSSGRVIDIEDPTSVRLEIKAALDSSVPYLPPDRHTRAGVFLLGCCVAAVLAGLWHFAQRPITRVQQETLKTLVYEVARLEGSASPARIWKDVKAPLNVTRYQDITWWGYHRAMARLTERAERLRANAALIPLPPSAQSGQ